MFTGIIEGTGKVVYFRGGKDGGRLAIRAGIPLGRVKLGESLSVDGCCLTVVKRKGKVLTFDVSDETWRKTIISTYEPQTIVNLERALRVSDRLGGHFVLGHVDAVGRIKKVRRQKGSLEIEIGYPKKLKPFFIDKGSVAVDGVSLTLSLCKGLSFKIYIIPHTEKLTTLSYKTAGDSVNLEADVLGKYARRLILQAGRGRTHYTGRTT